MRRLALLGAVVALLGGCGGGDGRSAAPAVSATPTPPDSQTLKYDLLTAAIQLEAYKLAEQRYTDDETKLGEAFPPTVTVKDSDATSFYMAARDDKAVRYTLRKDADGTTRECDPPSAAVCPGGRW